MASTAADHSPRASSGPSSLWSNLVRGEAEAAQPPPPSASVALENVPSSSSDTAPAPPQLEIPDHGSAAASPVKKPVWNVPSNGSIEARSIMGDSIWPALSESTKASPKSSSSDSLKSLSDGSVSAPTGNVISPSPKPSANNPSPNSSPNAVAPARQKSIKRSGGGASSGGALPNGGAAPPSPSPSPVMPEITPEKQTFQQPSPKGLPNNNTNSLDHGGRGGGFTPQPHGGNDHHRSYGGNRRGNNGGGGPHHNNYGIRRDQEWNHRNFSSRDVHMQPPPPRGMRPYIRQPAPAPPPFITPPTQGRPFATPMGYPDMPSPMYYVPAPPPPEALRGVPFVAHAPPPPMFFPVVDPQRAMLLRQIDYYFSSENLCKDIYLRNNMDNQGWVPITLIANFNRVKLLTNNIQYILDTVRLSTIVEVQGEKIRRRTDWMSWILPPSPNHFSNSAPQSPATPSHDTLAARLETVGLEGATNQNSMGGPTCNEVAMTRSASGNLSNQVQLQTVGDLNGDGNGQVTGHRDSDRSKYARSLVRSDTL